MLPGHVVDVVAVVGWFSLLFVFVTTDWLLPSFNRVLPSFRVLYRILY